MKLLRELEVAFHSALDQGFLKQSTTRLRIERD
jgi:hypothetical protein